MRPPGENHRANRNSSAKSISSSAKFPPDVPVLITGESGTGKELIAKSIHLSSSRADHPFIAVNCAAIPKDLLESEPSATEKAPYRRHRIPPRLSRRPARLLFLDEIGDMPLSLQSKLLRALQEKEITRLGSTEPISVDVRVLSATNQDLPARPGRKFREDSSFRLNVVPVRVPPAGKKRGRRDLA
ncbi:MAG: sigma-54 factor interaction domain-containing protein [bacterium]